MTGTVEQFINIARHYIPDRKTKTDQAVYEELGFTEAKAGQKETFYPKHKATATPEIFIEPYLLSGTATFSGSSKYIYMWNSTDLSCTLSAGGTFYDPPANKIVKASYPFIKKLKYLFMDNDLIELFPDAVNWINNTYDMSYSVSDVSPNYIVGGLSNERDKHIFAMSVALMAQNIMIKDLMDGGIGVAFRGSMHSLDNRAQLDVYTENRKNLLLKLEEILSNEKLGDLSSYGVDIYDEKLVDS